MKILRFGPTGNEKPAAIGPDGVVRSVEPWLRDWVGECLSPSFLARFQHRLENEFESLNVVQTDKVRIGPPISPRQIITVGANYVEHLSQVGISLTTEPIIAGKSVRAVCGPNDDLLLPPNCTAVDWEVELGVVIGKRAYNLQSSAEALPCIAGYCTTNDISDRNWLLERSGQWIKGKSFPTFAPIGPYLVTLDEFQPTPSTELICNVNDKNMQHGSLSQMRFTVYEIIHHISQFMILDAGDVILTGSPSGSALGRESIPFLKNGDILEISVGSLGTQTRRCVSSNCFNN